MAKSLRNNVLDMGVNLSVACSPSGLATNPAATSSSQPQGSGIKQHIAIDLIAFCYGLFPNKEIFPPCMGTIQCLINAHAQYCSKTYKI